MNKLIQFAKRISIMSVISVQIFALSAPVYAQEVPPTDSSADASTSTIEAPPPAPEPQPFVALPATPSTPATPKQSTANGPNRPTGADRNTFTQNPETGLWENGYYTWNPATQERTSAQDTTPVYNPNTGLWDTTQMVYSPAAGSFVPIVTSRAIISNTGPNSSNSIGGFGGSQFGISNTGPNSTNTINNNGNVNASLDLLFNGSVNNNINSTATSGGASVQGNTNAGSALTGDAVTIANVLNMLQSSWFGQSSDLATFIANLDGNVYGDLLLDPSKLAGGASNTNLDVNVSANANINNDINLAAMSGDATVDSNTNAGDATSGNARVLLNLFNLINSSISSNKSFIGMLNINGNLDGDILLPEGLLQFLITATGPNSNNQISNNNTSSLDVDVEKNRTIINDVNATAYSGNALVDSNTTAGNASSGEAETKVNTLNLVGQNIKAKNGLLVFVNVFGKWVGLLFNAPQGTSSIATTGPNSDNTITNDNNTSLSVTAKENSLINNDIYAGAGSGNATVQNNTNAGSAKTGDADVSVNILNMIDSTLDFSDFFGVLFINVFGTWNGSFGVNTAAGNAPSGGQGGGVFQFAANSLGSAAKNVASPAKKARHFVASLAGSDNGDVAAVNTATATSSTTTNGRGAGAPAQNAAAAAQPGSSKQIILASAAGLLALLALYFADNRYSLIARIRN